MGWSEVRVGERSRLFAGVEHERFYFVHSYAVQAWTLEPTGAFAGSRPGHAGRVTVRRSSPRSRMAP